MDILYDQLMKNMLVAKEVILVFNVYLSEKRMIILKLPASRGSTDNSYFKCN